MGVKLGLHAKLYRNTGSGGTPAWNEITNVRDVTLNLDVNGGEKSWRWAVEKCGALEWRIGC